MTYLFSTIPSNLARFCANKPIHVIIGTALLASLTYLTLVENYVAHFNTNEAYSELQHFYHGPSSNDNWIQLAETDISQYEKADHLALTPIKFKRSTKQFYPLQDQLIYGSDESDSFLLTDFTNYDEQLQSMSTLTNSIGDKYKERRANKIGRYYEYIKQFVLKTANLAKGAEPFDIALMTLAYIAMWLTFIQLFYEMKKVGSNFWLAFGSLLSSGFAFLFSIVLTTEVLGKKVPLISLTEGLPFLVATVGFKHKVSFTAPVVKALGSRRSQDRDIAQIIADVVKSETALPLVKEQLILSLSFLIGSFLVPTLVGFQNFCILSSVIMAVDLLFTFTFYCSILSLKAQITKVHRQIELKQVLEEDGISESVAESVALKQSPALFRHDNAIVSFKLITIVGFLSLHLFVLGTSWLYDDASDHQAKSLISSRTNTLSSSITKNITVGQFGTLISVFPTKIYHKVTLITNTEDFVLGTLQNLSKAIRDPLISKFLFILAGISVAINIYLLNVTRFHLALTTLNSLAMSRTVSKNATISSAPISSTPSTEKKSKKLATPALQPFSPLNVSKDDVKEAQIVSSHSSSDEEDDDESVQEISRVIRPLEELTAILKAGNVKECGNEEVLSLVLANKLPLYALEKQLGDKTRAVVVRRLAIAKLADAPILSTMSLPYKHYDYDRVFGACCENVIGFMPLPVGVAGPLIIDGVPYHIPMATTEGCLVASTMRGCKAINSGGGVSTVLTNDGMTRGPCVSFPSLSRTGAAKLWLDSLEGQKKIKAAFNSTSRFARLQHIQTAMAGTLLFIRFKTTTGDAMGMNMISKGVEHSLNYMVNECGFDDMEIISVSGNYCTDKKAAAINWVEGRGKSVVAEARIPASVVEKVLKSDVEALVELNISKNLIGSAMAGSIGGFNAHAANLVTAVYLATGQDPAQNVESSNCITLMNKLPNGDLQISVSMPSIEVGTIGGGTVLEPQSAMLTLLGVKGPHPTEPGANARQLAKVVASAVLAAELSLCSALAAGHLVQSHMTHNRKGGAAGIAATSTPSTTAGTDSSAGVVVESVASSSGTDGFASAREKSAVSGKDLKRLEEGSKICIRS